jgi:uncharacterized protein (DUF58 family)
VLDKKEKNPLIEGDFKLKDSETNDILRTYVSPKLLEEYLEMLYKHSSEIEHECALRGIDFQQISTEMPIFDAFYAILKK